MCPKDGAEFQIKRPPRLSANATPERRIVIPKGIDPMERNRKAVVDTLNDTTIR